MAVKKGGLGRGLDALFNENANDSEGALTLKINDIEPNRDQPRKDFDEQSLSELAQSIEKHGLIQPIIVRPQANGTYRIVAGERRWRACRMAGLQEVPVIIKEIGDRDLMELALIENLQREDLNAYEEAAGYKTLIDTYGLTQEQVAEQMGKSRSAVTNALRLLSLNDEELECLRAGLISAGHARALLAVGEGSFRAFMLDQAKKGASVRELERMSSGAKKNGIKKEKTKRAKSNFYSEVELSLRNETHRKVNITSKGNGKGVLAIEFYSDDELADFARRLAED